MEKTKLPIEAYENEIVRTIRDNQVTIITAETGAGKSTMVPLFLERAGFGVHGNIGITEPRRPAAVNLAKWVAQLHGSPLGRNIGYHIRGDRKFDRDARVRYMTEGILLRQLHSDPYLTQYSTLVIDEVHERGVNQDLLLALMKQVLRNRSDLRIAIMSATMKAGNFSAHFDGAPIIDVPGRVFPVKWHFLAQMSYRIQDAFIDQIRAIIDSGDTGDILCFFPDKETITKACKDLEDTEFVRDARILPLYGDLPPDEQDKVLERDGRRRIIVSTNIAETSLTIDGVTCVVDTGLIKESVYVNASMSGLRVVDHSKAGITQRAGRAGRTAPGKYFALFTKEDFDDRREYTEPEIKRMSLDQVLLHLRCLDYNMDEVTGLEFMDPPGDTRWQEAEKRLVLFGALDKDDSVTDDGRFMERLGESPSNGRIILAGIKNGNVEQAVTAVADNSTRSVFYSNEKVREQANVAHAQFKVPESDALTALRVWDAWCKAPGNGKRGKWAFENFLNAKVLGQMERNREHLFRTLEALEIEITSNDDPTLLRKTVAAGLIANLCKFQGEHAYEWNGQFDIYIFPGSALFKVEPRYMVCTEIVKTSKIFARGCTAIEEAWLEELLPDQALDVKVSIRPSLFTSEVEAYEEFFWQGVKIRERKLVEIKPEHLIYFSLAITGEIVKDRWNQPFHPQSIRNREVWNAIANEASIGVFGLFGTIQEMLEKYEKIKQIYGFIRDRIAVAKPKTPGDIRAVDIALKLEDYLDPNQVEKYQARIEEKARWQTEEQARRAEHDQLRRVEEETRREKLKTESVDLLVLAEDLEKRLARLVEDLKKRLARLDGTEAYELLLQVRGIKRSLEQGYSSFLDFTRKDLNKILQRTKELEREQVNKVELTVLGWTKVLEHLPSCPLCNSNWKEYGDRTLVCNGAHNFNRLIPVEGDHFQRIGVYQTNRDQDVASVDVNEGTGEVRLNFVLPKTHAWTENTFKSVRYTPEAVILPEELANERDGIMESLQELCNARRELEKVVAQVKAAEAKVGAGAMKRLTFKADDRGRMMALDNGKRYVSAYQDPYPQEGETWFCRIGRDLSISANLFEVHPEFKAGSVSSIKDIEELAEVVKELYPGLPAQLLQVQ